MNIICTICSDLVNQDNIFVTKCGHIFHNQCLVQWITRSASCPQCRHKVTERCMFRAYPTLASDAAPEEAATLQARLDDAQLQLRQQRATLVDKDHKLDQCITDLQKTQDQLKANEKKLVARESAIAALKEQILYLKVQNNETEKLRMENQSLEKNINTLNGLQRVLNATSGEVEEMLQGYSDLRTVATFATALKRALCESEAKKKESRDKLEAARAQLLAERGRAGDLARRLLALEDHAKVTSRKYEALKLKRKAEAEAEAEAEADGAARAKQRKAGAADPACDRDPDPDRADPDVSLNSMVRRIETAESPYLRLQRGAAPAAFALKVPAAGRPAPVGVLQPSEYSILPRARPAPAPAPAAAPPPDGLGGRARPEAWPSPAPAPARACLPRRSAKHRLRRP